MNNKSRLLYVKYADHVFFRHTNPHRMKPSIREVVGWLVRETDDALYLSHDRATIPLPFEKITEFTG